MTGAPETSRQHAAVLALHDAIATRRQHPEQGPLQQAVQRKAWQAIHAATASATLVIGLEPHGVHVGAVALPLSGAPASPFGPLRRAGIGQLHLLAGFPLEELAPLVQHLAAATADAERAIAALRSDPRIQHVRLCTPPGVATDGDADDGLDWAALPTPAEAPALQSLVARDLACNLPALAARQVLEDLAADAATPDDDRAIPDDDGMLRRLLIRLLEQHDLATASWLLGETSREPAVPPTLVTALADTAAEVADARWLDALLARERDDDWTALATFATQLPAEAAAALADRLGDRPHPRAHWLRELLG